MLQVPISSSYLDEECIKLSIQRTVSTQAYCCICHEKIHSIVVPEEAVKRKIYISYGNRCCHTHLIKNRFYENDLNAIRVVSNTPTINKRNLDKLSGAMNIDSITYKKNWTYF